MSLMSVPAKNQSSLPSLSIMPFEMDRRMTLLCMMELPNNAVPEPPIEDLANRIIP